MRDDLLFPFKDETSSYSIATLRAECLLQPGVVDVAEACREFRRAGEVLYRAGTPHDLRLRLLARTDIAERWNRRT